MRMNYFCSIKFHLKLLFLKINFVVRHTSCLFYVKFIESRIFVGENKSLNVEYWISSVRQKHSGSIHSAEFRKKVSNYRIRFTAFQRYMADITLKCSKGNSVSKI